MARYGRGFDRDRYGMRGDEGQGYYGGSSEFGNHWRGNQGDLRWGGGEYGGMGSDAQGGYNAGGQSGRGYSGFGSGGGAYDDDYSAGRGQGSFGSGYGSYGGNYGGGSMGGGLSRGRGGDYYSAGGYGYETGGYGGQRDYQSGGAGGGYGYGGGYGGSDRGTSYGGGGDWGARDTGYGQMGGGTGLGSGNRGGMGMGGGQEELRRMRASEIMTDNPECVTPDTSLADAAMKMRDLDVGIIPVVDSEQGRRLRGVVTDRDITIRAVAEGMDARSTKVSQVMTTDVETCNKNDTVQDILRVMEREQVRRVPITDRDGRLVGIVAQADVIRDVDSREGELRVADTVEAISEPGRGGRGGMRASQSRGGTSGGGMSGSSRGFGTSMTGGTSSGTGGYGATGGTTGGQSNMGGSTGTQGGGSDTNA